MAINNNNQPKLGDILHCQEKQTLYDSRNINSIMNYAKMIRGKTFRQILIEANLSAEEIAWVESKQSDKGLPGKIIEASYFGYELNSRQEADFEHVGLELKSTPVDIKKDGSLKVGETLSITQIDFAHPVQNDFYKSHLFQKLNWMLVVFYLRNRTFCSKLDYEVLYPCPVRPTYKDLLIIEQDYLLINQKIQMGKAHTLSRRDGIYLGTAPKSTKASKTITPFYGGPPLVKRSYTLKKSYVQEMLNVQIQNEEHLVKNPSELLLQTLPEIIYSRLRRYENLDIEVIAQLANCTLKKKWSSAGRWILTESTFPDLTAHMLGLRQLRNVEFLKAGIVVKTIVFSRHGINNQQFRLGDADLMEIAYLPDTYLSVEQDEYGNDQQIICSGWEESDLFNILDGLKYLFVVYQETTSGTVYRGCRLWGMSDEDIELAHQDWLDLKKILNSGVEFTRVPWGNGERTENSFPGSATARIIHLRPHGNKSFYVDSDTSWGNGCLNDTVPIPHGKRIVRQSYWLKQTYVRALVKDLLILND